MADIQERSRLVQNDDLWLLTDGPGQKDSLALAIADRRKIPVLQIPGMNQLHGCAHFFVIFRRKNAKNTRIGVTSRSHNILAGHEFRLHPARHNHRKLPGNLLIRHFFHGFLI